MPSPQNQTQGRPNIGIIIAGALGSLGSLSRPLPRSRAGFRCRRRAETRQAQDLIRSLARTRHEQPAASAARGSEHDPVCRESAVSSRVALQVAAGLREQMTCTWKVVQLRRKRVRYVRQMPDHAVRLDAVEVVSELFHLGIKHTRSELAMLIAQNAKVFGDLLDAALAAVQEALQAETLIAGKTIALLAPDHKTQMRACQIFLDLVQCAN